jgi:hypothetical protein
MKTISTTLLMLSYLFVVGQNLPQGMIVKGEDDGVEVNPAAIFEARSTEKGFLIPRLNTSEITNLTEMIEANMIEAKSLLVFNSDSLWIQFYKNTGVDLGAGIGWVPLISGDTQQEITSLTLQGTTLTIDVENGDDQSVDLALMQDHDWYDGNNQPSQNINSDIHTFGKTGIGILPTNQLHVASIDGNDAVRIEGLQDGTLSNDVVVTNNNGELKKVDSEHYIQSICPFTPPPFFSYFEHIGTGDEDFEGHGPAIMGSVTIYPNPSQIIYSINLNILETEWDNTEGEIIVNYVAYTVPDGFIIDNVICPNITSTISYTDTNTVWDMMFANGSDSLVRRCKVNGDTEGDDFYQHEEGCWVEIIFNSITVILVPEP